MVSNSTLMEMLLFFTPFVIFLELPMITMVIVGVFAWSSRQKRLPAMPKSIPKVSCLLIAYSEGEELVNPIRTLAYQEYPGEIEIIVVIDGAIQNKETYEIAKSFESLVKSLPNRELVVMPKWQRGGRVSSMNLGVKIATGKIFMALDGDTSFDNDMVINAVRNFDDDTVVAVAGNLRVRNASDSIATRLQALEYLLSIGTGRTGLSSFNMVNNISGAFGIFRIEILRLVGGWDTGTAEDLDMTTRLKQRFGSHKDWQIVFDPHIMGHTEVPGTLMGFFDQRIRWEGDLFYVVGRKYRENINPKLLGILNYIFVMVGILFFQVIMPFVITFYTIFMLYAFPIEQSATFFLIVYIFYMFILIILYSIYILLISERVKEDLIYIIYLPLFPIFTFLARLNAALALLHSIVNHSHLDSSMAPYWVLKKGHVH